MRTVIYLSFMIVLGLILLAFSWKTGDDTFTCSKKSMFNVQRAFMAISLLTVAVPVSALACLVRCNCGDNQGVGILVMFGIIALLGIALVILGSIMSVHSDTFQCDVKDMSKQIIIIGSVIIGTSVSFGAVNLLYFRNK